MPTYNISLNKELAVLVEKRIKEGKFANRSEFFRQMLRFLFLSSGSDFDDWIYSEPHSSELKKRVKRYRANEEKIYSGNEIDQEFNLKESNNPIFWDYDTKNMDLEKPEVMRWYLERKLKFGDLKDIDKSDLKKYLPELNINPSLKELLTNYFKKYA